MRAPLAFLARLTGMAIYVCVITMRASLASPSRLTGMVICVCVMAIVEKMGECRFWNKGVVRDNLHNSMVYT